LGALADSMFSVNLVATSEPAMWRSVGVLLAYYYYYFVATLSGVFGGENSLQHGRNGNLP
jgi:hypothetical protein